MKKEPEKSIIGVYGSWAAGLLQDPPGLSFRRPTEDSVESWSMRAKAKVGDCILPPVFHRAVQPTTLSSHEVDGIHRERLHWQLPYGHQTEAILLKPAEGTGPWPGILALHDHGGNKYLGWRKIASYDESKSAFIQDHHDHYYGGVAWANELARRGYVVLVHDTFTFGSRRVRLEDVKGIEWGMPDVTALENDTGEDRTYIESYNRWASAHEHILSKSLFCAGTTWPGVFFREDQVALDVLAARPEVDQHKMGCCGLSGGGLRTVYLGGLDDRIKCAIAVGFMSTWKDFLLHKSYTHTWMTYAPGLPRHLDFPEILAARVPQATMVLNNNEDQLFTLSHMHKADRIIQEIFSKAEAEESYKCNFYEGLHKFDRTMQSDAFAWFDQWLG